MTTPLNACTIVSKNYICYARVLCDSFLDHHPDGRFFVLLVDRNDGSIDVDGEKFTLFEAEDLANIPRRDAFLFKYTLLECNTAVKPFFLEHLIEAYDLPNLVYFDPDIMITGSLDQLAQYVEQYSVVLTPHLTDPIEDQAFPNEQAILQSGSYNLGFVAFRTTETSRRVIRWWQDRLYDKCVVRIADGLFVDQKWMDLVPGMFGGLTGEVLVLNHPGYNVAYWNLHGRRVTMGPDGPESNGMPLVFFHFSGIRPESLEGVSKHQDRFELSDIGEAAQLYREYADKVIKAGYFDCRPWPYAFGRFDNGVRIPDAARSLFHGLTPGEQATFHNPFTTGGANAFFDWLNQPVPGASVSRLLHHLYQSRSDLNFGDILREPGWVAYSAWLAEYGRHELNLDPEMLRGLDLNPGDWLTPVGLKRRIRHGLKRVYHSGLGKQAKTLLKRSLGPERSRRLKTRLRKPVPVAATAGSGVGHSNRGIEVNSLGLNLVGYLDAETGMGQAGRSLVAACRAAAIPVSPHTLEVGVVARRQHTAFAGATSDFEHGINLFVVNADQAHAVRDHLGRDVYHGRYNIGLWLWEQERFPDSLRGAFELYDEIWTPSSFCVDAISAVSPVPVRRIPLPVTSPEGAADGTDRAVDDLRRELDLPQGAFVFLFMFSFLSYAQRKNPEAAVQAFKQAFGDAQDRVLVLKTSQKDFAPEAYDRLVAKIGGADNIRLIDDYYSSEQVETLTRAADAYLSLHRSEGFGLTLAEAMVQGKPVVATPYSGVTDFFNVNNGYPVRYRLVTLEQDVGPYPAGSVWADADVDHAAEQLKRLVADDQERAALARRAQQDIRDLLSPETVGAAMKRQLTEVLRQDGFKKTLSMPLG